MASYKQRACHQGGKAEAARAAACVPAGAARTRAGRADFAALAHAPAFRGSASALIVRVGLIAFELQQLADLAELVGQLDQDVVEREDANHSPLGVHCG